MATSEEKTVIYQKKGKIAYITLNRPRVLNAVNQQMYLELADAWVSVRDDSDVWVAILSGAGRCFSSGMDVKEARSRDDDKEARGRAEGGEPRPSISRAGPRRLMSGIEVWKPIIAACHGYVYGTALELAMSCDFRIAADNAIFGLPEALRALIPVLGVTAKMPFYLPFPMALDMCLLGEDITAEDAYRVGFVKKVVSQDELIPTAEALANRIVDSLSPLVISLTKQLLYSRMKVALAEGTPLEAILGSIEQQSEDAAEGRRAFVEKRKPEYKGR